MKKIALIFLMMAIPLVSTEANGEIGWRAPVYGIGTAGAIGLGVWGIKTELQGVSLKDVMTGFLTDPIETAMTYPKICMALALSTGLVTTAAIDGGRAIYRHYYPAQEPGQGQPGVEDTVDFIKAALAVETVEEANAQLEEVEQELEGINAARTHDCLSRSSELTNQYGGTISFSRIYYDGRFKWTDRRKEPDNIGAIENEMQDLLDREIKLEADTRFCKARRNMLKNRRTELEFKKQMEADESIDNCIEMLGAISSVGLTSIKTDNEIMQLPFPLRNPSRKTREAAFEAIRIKEQAIKDLRSRYSAYLVGGSDLETRIKADFTNAEGKAYQAKMLARIKHEKAEHETPLAKVLARDKNEREVRQLEVSVKYRRLCRLRNFFNELLTETP